MVLSQDNVKGRVTLSTKKLEATPGDMLRDPQLVFDHAEETAKIFQQRIATVGEGVLSGEDVEAMRAVPVDAKDLF